MKKKMTTMASRLSKKQLNAIHQIASEFLEKGNAHLPFTVRMLALGFIQLAGRIKYLEESYADLQCKVPEV